MQRYDFRRLKCRQTNFRLLEMNGFTMPPTKLGRDGEVIVTWERERGVKLTQKKIMKKMEQTHGEFFNGLSK